jgi:hypothetical protein
MQFGQTSAVGVITKLEPCTEMHTAYDGFESKSTTVAERLIHSPVLQ